jgi:hypothetical protein
MQKGDIGHSPTPQKKKTKTKQKEAPATNNVKLTLKSVKVPRKRDKSLI